MIRRHAPTSTPSPRSLNSAPTRHTPARGGALKKRSGEESSPFCSVWFLLTLAALLTVLTYVFPDEAARVEHNAESYGGEMAHELFEAEQKMLHWWGPEHAETLKHETSSEATQRMMQQDSKWVDGEKKLKAKLKVLAERQKEGKDIGVPVLTRYLGEDIPAWPSEGMDKAEWEAKVAERYKLMSEEEERWKSKVNALLREHQYG